MWKAGDIAILIDDGRGCHEDAARLFGREIQLLRPSYEEGYDWDFFALGSEWETRESCLKRLPPPNEITTWEEMEDIFIPKELVTI